MDGWKEDEGKELGQWSGGKKREEVAGKRTEDGQMDKSGRATKVCSRIPFTTSRVREDGNILPTGFQ